MGFVVKAWAVAISLVFVLCTSLVIGALAIMTTATLFVAALIATPFFFLFDSASTLLGRATEIVVTPLRFARSTIEELWQQLWTRIMTSDMGTGTGKDTGVVAAVAMRLALTVVCLTAIGLLPLGSFWEALAYTLAITVLIITWTAFFVQQRLFSNDLTPTVIILLTITASILTIIAISPIGSWHVLAFLLAGLALVIVWILVINDA